MILKVPKKTQITEVAIGNYVFDFTKREIECSNPAVAQILIDDYGCKAKADDAKADEPEISDVAPAEALEVTE